MNFVDITVEELATTDGHYLVSVEFEINEGSRKRKWFGGTYETKIEMRAEIGKRLELLRDRKPLTRVCTNLSIQDDLCIPIGIFLFEALTKSAPYERDLREVIHPEASPARLSLFLPSSLSLYPWEPLLDPNEKTFLALHHSVVRYDQEGSGHDAKNLLVLLDEREQTRLCVVADTSDLRYSDEEVPDTPGFKVQHPGIWKDFTDFLKIDKQSPSAFMFLGHGRFQKFEEEFKSFLVFVRKERSGTALKKALRLEDPRESLEVSAHLNECKNLRFGMLLACESAHAESYFRFKHSIVGVLMRYTEIPILIGAQAEVNQHAGWDFLEDCIVQLQQCSMVDLDRVVTTARHRLRHGADEVKSLDWWIPVIYARTANFSVTGGLRSQALPRTGAGRS